MTREKEIIRITLWGSVVSRTFVERPADGFCGAYFCEDQQSSGGQ